MILDRDRVSCDDFSDCHNKISVAGIDLIGRQLILWLYLQGEGVLLVASNEDRCVESCGIGFGIRTSLWLWRLR